RYIAPAPTATPMPTPAQKFTSHQYHDSASAMVEGVALFLAAVATFIGLGLVVGGTRAGISAAQLGGLAAVPLLGARVLGHTPRDLGFRRPRARELLAAVLLGVGFWYVNLRITAPTLDWFRGKEELDTLRAHWVAPEAPIAM